MVLPTPQQSFLIDGGPGPVWSVGANGVRNEDPNADHLTRVKLSGVIAKTIFRPASVYVQRVFEKSFDRPFPSFSSSPLAGLREMTCIVIVPGIVRWAAWA